MPRNQRVGDIQFLVCPPVCQIIREKFENLNPAHNFGKDGDKVFILQIGTPRNKTFLLVLCDL